VEYALHISDFKDSSVTREMFAYQIEDYSYLYNFTRIYREYRRTDETSLILAQKCFIERTARCILCDREGNEEIMRNSQSPQVTKFIEKYRRN
jgi:hypothetical protein